MKQGKTVPLLLPNFSAVRSGVFSFFFFFSSGSGGFFGEGLMQLQQQVAGNEVHEHDEGLG